MKRDVTYQEATFKNWKEKVLDFGIKGINKNNSKLILDYIFDMETGQNIAKRSKKGARGFERLNVSKNKIIQIVKMLEQRGIKDISKLTEKQAHLFFHDIYTGKIKREDGELYQYAGDFVRLFKAFWHWFMKVKKKEGKIIEDICEDLEVKTPSIKFVYFTKEQLDKLIPYFNYDEQILCKFLFDSVVRFPTECLSLQAKQVYEKEGEVWVNVPDEISKSIGRTFNLLYCGEALIKYIKEKKLKPDDYIFPIKDHNQVYAFNKKLKQVAVQVLGDKISHPKAQGKFSEISGYDFRHSGVIHLRILAQKNNAISLDAIRQRMGDKTFEMLNYYTQFIGLDGAIKKEALLIQEDKTKLEKELLQVKKAHLDLIKVLQKKGIIPR